MREPTMAPVALYQGVFGRGFHLEVFLQAQGIAYDLVADRELADAETLRGRRLFIFPPGHCFDPVPAWALGRGPATVPLQEAVARGMSYLGICAGAFAAIRTPSWPVDLDLGLCPAHHRWPGETGAGTQFFTFGVAPELARAVRLPEPVARLWYHNGPIYTRSRNAGYEVLAWFEPAPEERRTARGGFLKGKHLRGAPAIIECRYGAGSLVLCSPHPELGDLSIHEYREAVLAWLQDHGPRLGGPDPLGPGTPGKTAFMAELGGVHFASVRNSANWRLLRGIVDRLLQ